MSKKIEQLKSMLYSQIDQIQDEATLQMLQDAVMTYSSQNENLNELTADQQNRLQESIQQAQDGKTFTNEEVKQKTKEWLSK
jgi:hypothetical protein